MFGQLIEKHAGLSQWPDSTLRFDREKPRSIVKLGTPIRKKMFFGAHGRRRRCSMKGTIFADHDYPNEVFKRRNEYHRAKTPQQPDSRKRFSCRPLGARRTVTKPEWRLIIRKKANASAAEKLRMFRRDTDDWRVQIVLQIWYYIMVIVTLLSRVVNSASYFSFLSLYL